MPNGQGVHRPVLPDPVWYVPPPQARHCALLVAPCGLPIVPDPQSWQTLAPDPVWNVAALHATHAAELEAPSPDWYRPAAHGEQLDTVAWPLDGW